MPAVYELVESGNDVERLRQLLQTGETPNDLGPHHNIPLHAVASKQRTDLEDIEDSVRMARELIDFGACIDMKNTWQNTPLLCAVLSENRRLVEFFLEEKAHIHACDNGCDTALHLAIRKPRSLPDHPVWDEYYATRKPILEMVKTILRFNPDLNSKNSRSITPVLLAAEYQDLPVLKELLERKANANCMNSESSKVSPMYRALNRPINLEIVLELIRHRGRFYNPDVFDIYISRLKNASLVELKKAKSVFKHFFLGKESLANRHLRMIEELSETKSFPLSQYIVDLRSEISQMSENKLESCEISQMSQDKLASEFSVYNLAQRGFFCTCEEKKDLFSHFFDAVPQKLKNSEYPLYHDLIASGISRSHVMGKFEVNMVKFLNNKDVSFLLISYLSHLDMFNFIVALTE